MRLVCPNCDAQYEVDDAAIPVGGRDVQCSNCGHAWFQIHPEEEAALSLEEEVFEPVEEALPEALPDDLPEVMIEEIVAESREAPRFGAYGEDGPAPRDEEELFPADPGDAPPPPPRRVEVDENVLAVLREEAEREVAVRRTEAPPGVEVQADLGLSPPPPVSPSVLAAQKKFRELSVDHDAAGEELSDDPAAKPASRRELLPDIEEINSTLRASGDPRGDDDDLSLPPQYEERRSGFRSGFVLMIVISVALWMAYVMAPRIVEQIPASAGTMDTYVAAVNKARIGVDLALQSASKSLRSLSGEDKASE